MQGQGKREIPDKTPRPTASSGKIPTCENPGATPPRIKPNSPRPEEFADSFRDKLESKTRPLAHVVFDTTWRTVPQSSPSTVTTDNQCTVDIAIFVHKIVESSLQGSLFARVSGTRRPPFPLSNKHAEPGDNTRVLPSLREHPRHTQTHTQLYTAGWRRGEGMIYRSSLKERLRAEDGVNHFGSKPRPSLDRDTCLRNAVARLLTFSPPHIREFGRLLSVGRQIGDRRGDTRRGDGNKGRHPATLMRRLPQTNSESTIHTASLACRANQRRDIASARSIIIHTIENARVAYSTRDFEWSESDSVATLQSRAIVQHLMGSKTNRNDVLQSSVHVQLRANFRGKERGKREKAGSRDDREARAKRSRLPYLRHTPIALASPKNGRGTEKPFWETPAGNRSPQHFQEPSQRRVFIRAAGSSADIPDDERRVMLLQKYEPRAEKNSNSNERNRNLQDLHSYRGRFIFPVSGDYPSAFLLLTRKFIKDFPSKPVTYEFRILYGTTWANTPGGQSFAKVTPSNATNWAAVAERLACSPPTKANWIQSPAGSLMGFRMWESCRTMPMRSFSSGSHGLRRCPGRPVPSTPDAPFSRLYVHGAKLYGAPGLDLKTILGIPLTGGAVPKSITILVPPSYSHEIQTVDDKTNAWCGLRGNRLIGNFIKGILGTHYYRQILESDSPLSLEDVPLAVLRKMWLSQDGAPLDFSKAVTEFLNAEYPRRWTRTDGPGPMATAVS
ncbi:hypothetical protein PR048_017705 [Dryococelus australis]|uniref:Uncharacterized protein n=1 Tax=Dryococelus australis TaxID=614101 RepID=A0ABQ9HAF3_9NEOP|nr:hypothetical protein PR048_017705 [Dryococelus australis]